ncbi:MAG: FHA domain-containing protein [Myxococcales bacterium]
MPFELTIAAGGERGRRFVFGAVEVTIGRAPENDLLLVEPGVSRSHARIRADGPGHVLVDEGSRNGTALNGMPIRGAAALSRGDRIGIGPVVFEYAPGRRMPVPGSWMIGAMRVAGVAARRALRSRLAGSPWWAQICVACATASCLLLAASASVQGQDPGANPVEKEVAPVGNDPLRVGAAGVEREVDAAPASRRAQAAHGWYERGRRKLEERRIAPRNLYDAWRSFENARQLLEGQELPPPLDALPRLAEAAARDLERQCRNLLFAARRFARYGEEQKARAAYREVLLHFPGEDPSGCRERVQRELSADAPEEGSAG